MKVLTIIKYLFTVLGIAMLLGTLYINESTRSFMSQAIKTEGTVVRLAESWSGGSTVSHNSSIYRPVVRFRDRNGLQHEFISSSGSNPPSYLEGEKVELLYLPDKPENAQINEFVSLWAGSIILGGLGTLFLFVGGGIFFVPMLKKQKNDVLRAEGTPIETEFQSVLINTAVSVNGNCPFQVVTQWKNPATSEIHIFKSDNIWYDPSQYIRNKRIRVFIDRNNPKRYYVDLSFLPKLAG
ncbi:MAG: DUF3592 domain-containing protein [Chlorobiaceae bacterium]|nr:DUF3592 domain-containing protein [Chlorobiaceae bacterium]